MSYNQEQIALQMARIQQAGIRMQAALQRAERVQISPRFRTDAAELMRQLGGEPGDAALEIFRDLERDIEATRAFITDWEHDTTSEIRAVISIAKFTEQQLKLLQEMYQTMPSVERDRMTSNVRFQRSLQGKLRDFRWFIPVAGPITAIVAYQLFGLYAMIAVAWGALILFGLASRQRRDIGDRSERVGYVRLLGVWCPQLAVSLGVAFVSALLMLEVILELDHDEVLGMTYSQAVSTVGWNGLIRSSALPALASVLTFIAVQQFLSWFLKRR